MGAGTAKGRKRVDARVVAEVDVGSRRFNETAVAETVKDAGYDPFEHKVLGITAMTKLLGKTRFEELLYGFIEKPQGKPTLVPMSDKRPAMNTAANDFKEDK